MGHNNLTLAITKIGDLLLRKVITTTKEKKSIDDVNLRIPVYQRPYKWTAKNAIQLLDDIIEAKSENKEVYRVGTLILHRKIANGEVIYDIVDGQQRVITFSLLLAVLGKEDIAFLNENLSNNDYNLRNVPNNLQAFRRRLGITGNDDKMNSDKKENSTESKDAERERENVKLKSFVEEQCELIVVITDNISEAFQFFDSQNARGKSLYPHDLLKAFHLREMWDVDEMNTERIVKEWEEYQQDKLASLFGEYLYRIKEWIIDSKAQTLNESNLLIFKGVTKKDRTPYAQFYKAAYAYADMVNHSAVPFVSGTRNLNAFQLDTPIIAGKPFFEYTKHYFSILRDIQNNNKYEGFYINDNQIVKTLDAFYKEGTGNRITRLMFDAALLLYVDRFCPATFPDHTDLEMFDRFVVYAFIWAYSLRAQLSRLSWLSAQNYIMGVAKRTNTEKRTNTMNIYKLIIRSHSATALLSSLADKICPLTVDSLPENIDEQTDATYKYYIHYFKLYGFLEKNDYE